MRRAVALLLLAPTAAAPLAAQGGSLAFLALGARVVGFRFFESGAGMPPVGGRSYSLSFDPATSRYINYEIQLSFPPASHRHDFTIQCEYRGPGGSIGSADIEAHVDSGWTTSFHSGGRGWPDQGKWTPGIYSVACQEGGRPLAAGSFAMAPGSSASGTQPAPAAPGPAPNPLLASGASIDGFRFYSHEGERPPPEARWYLTTFDSATARYIDFELRASFTRRLAAPLDVALDCTYTGPNGVLARPGVHTTIPAGRFFETLDGGVGPTAAVRGWAVGPYRVTCFEGPTVVAEGRFQILQRKVDVPELDATVTGVRFFESGRSRPSKLEDRKYATRFEARSTRLLNVEIRFAFPRLERDAQLPIKCGSSAGPDASNQNSFAEGQELGQLKRGWTGAAITVFLDNQAPNQWAKSSYWVECFSAGKLLAHGGFVIY